MTHVFTRLILHAVQQENIHVTCSSGPLLFHSAGVQLVITDNNTTGIVVFA